MSERKVHRIHGTPEQWLGEFISTHLPTYEGRVTGICVHLEVKGDVEKDEPEQMVIVWKDWPTRIGLVGHLQVTAHELIADVVGE